MKAGDRVKVDFIGESATIYSGKRFTGYGVLDRVEDGRVFGRLDDGTPFMCLCADVEVVGMSDFEKWFKDQDFYTNMRFIHGDKLFDKDGDVYRVLPVQMTYQGWSEQRQRSKGEFVELTQEWHTKGWNARQGEIDELQKENAALVHVIKSRDIQLENEKHEYDELVNKLVDSKMKNTKLQKRVDAALEITKQGIRKQGGDYYLEKLEQALNGGDE